MKKMIYKYNLRILMIFSISVFFSFLINAQTNVQDTLVSVKEKTKSVAFGTQPEWMVTSSISTVNGAELQKTLTTNLANTLSGRLSGLTVIQSGGEAGYDSPYLLSRGVKTFTSNKILVIVDGFESSFEKLGVDEIETVSLLKDASATAMYGSRGANGVLLVTTKRGTEGKLKVNFGVQHGYQQAIQLPEFLGSYDYARLYNEALSNDGKPAKYSDTDLAAYQSGSDPYLHPDVNWYDQVLRKSAPISNYDLNFSGGSEYVKYFVLLNVINNNGLYKNTGDLSDNSTNSRYTRYNFRSNIDVNLTQRLSATLNLAGAVEDKANPAGDNTSGIFWAMGKIAPNAFPVYNPDGSYGGSSIYSNPLGDILEKGFYTSNARTLQATFKMTGQLDMIAKGLSITGAVSFNNYFKGYSSKTRTYARYGIRDVAGSIAYSKIDQNSSLNGAEGNSDQWRQFAVQGLLNYNRSFDRHRIDGVLMVGSDNYLNRVGGIPTAINSFPYKHNNAGGRITYGNSEKYIAEFSFAVNGSENFPKDKRYGFFPAGSLGWVASNENFLKGNTSINYLKVRGSYGLVGNDVIGGDRFMFNPSYNYTSGYYLGTTNTSLGAVAQSAYANSDVTWEKSKTFNVGIELTLAKRIDISVDYFNESRFDILARPYATVPSYVAVTLPYLNVGKVNNKGFEAMVRYSGDKDKEFQYSVEANVWYSKNKLEYYSESPKAYDYMYQTGHPTQQPFGLEAIGLFKDETDIANSAVQSFSSKVQPGDIKYRDMNNDNRIDDLDVHAIGKSSLPDVTYSLHTLFQYKGFDLDAFFQGVAGRNVYLSGDNYEAFQNNGKIAPVALGRWTPATAESATYPRLSSVNNSNNFGVYSSYWQRNGDFIKLRSLELGYTLPQNLVGKIGLAKVRVYLNGTNLLTWDKLEYSDPEVMSGYPALKTFSIGAKFQF